MCPAESNSDARLAANRANAQHSTGPATAQAKERTRLNATRHGLTSQVACMPWEDRGAFDQFCAGLIADYRPAGVVETEIARSIAEDHWRLNRVRAIEHNIFALAVVEPSAPLVADREEMDEQMENALLQARAFRDHAQSFGLLTLYEQRINRNILRNEQRLRAHQAENRQARLEALAQAIEVIEARELQADQGVECIEEETTVVNGFVFSNRELRPILLRRRLRKAA